MFLRCNVLSTMSYSFFLIPLPYWFLADRKRIFSVMTKKKNSKIMEQPQVFFFSLIIMITLPGFSLSGPLCSSTVLCKSKNFLLLLEMILSNN